MSDDNDDKYERERDREIARRRGRASRPEQDIESILAHATAAHERHLAVRPSMSAEEAARTERARWLDERARVLIEGKFGTHEVDRCRLEDPGSTPALDAARRFVAQQELRILVLLGGVGAGKTTAATWVAREIGGVQPGKVLATTLERRGRYDREFADWIDERTLVVLDDLGAEPIDGKGYFAALVDEIVDRAYSHRRRLVITSNVDAPGLRERLGERVASRLFEAAMREGCGNVDLRRQLRSVS